MTHTLVPPQRFPRWVENFATRHGTTDLVVRDGQLAGRAEDGSTFAAELPFARSYTGAPTPGDFLTEAAPPPDWAVLLVRKGGFALARLAQDQISESKVGQRHVQGRTKAGGQSQQRFARRRGNQARAAYQAAAEHAVRLVSTAPLVVVGGDASAISAVLDDSRLHPLRGRVVGPFLTVPDPRRSILEAACADAQSIRVQVQNAEDPHRAV